MTTSTGVRRVSCGMGFAVESPSRLVLKVAPAGSAGAIVQEQLSVLLDGVAQPVEERATPYAGREHVVTVGAGVLSVSYVAKVGSATPAPPPDDLLETLRPSRYCPSDRLAGWARGEFGDSTGAGACASDVVAWVRARTVYTVGSSRGTDDAVETLLSGQGVCRDFAHLTVATCRALELPARLASAYAPGLFPMDFHAVAEVFEGGRWQVFDATGLSARRHLVRIATGRDAADTAFAEVLGGTAELTWVEVTATVDGELEADDGMDSFELA